jgi:ribosome biogenesis GTPase
MLVRPQVANIDLLCAVVSATLPEPDYLLLDKLCANAALIGVEAICLMNKADQADETEKQAFLTDYAAFAPHLVSAKTGEGLCALRSHFSDKTVCFAGQSGVGKSSLLNRLMPQRERQTAKLSERGSRGKHTTRVAELVAIEGGGMLVDTPGFSLMELPLMPPEDLRSLYPELVTYEGQCRFLGCLHHTEPGCAAKAAIGRGGITRGRYDRYINLLTQMQQRWRNRYE